jgi:hypothetical protein
VAGGLVRWGEIGPLRPPAAGAIPRHRSTGPRPFPFPGWIVPLIVLTAIPNLSPQAG